VAPSGGATPRRSARASAAVASSGGAPPRGRARASTRGAAHGGVGRRGAGRGRRPPPSSAAPVRRLPETGTRATRRCWPLGDGRLGARAFAGNNPLLLLVLNTEIFGSFRMNPSRICYF
jgi:hypothetical protein